MSRRKLLLYLLLNVLLSACTTLTVLWLWDRAHQREIIRLPFGLSAPQATPAGGDPLPPPGEKVIAISNVFGMGDLDNEVVVLERLGDGDLYLTGWKILDENNNIYTFPRLLLNKGGAVQVYTRSGSDTAISLYWGLGNPVWRSGESVLLVDSQGNERARFTIP